MKEELNVKFGRYFETNYKIALEKVNQNRINIIKFCLENICNIYCDTWRNTQ